MGIHLQAELNISCSVQVVTSDVLFDARILILHVVSMKQQYLVTFKNSDME